jgi:fucose permease
MLLFLLLGTTVGSWLSRAPDVKDQVHLDDAAWGAVLVSSTVGSLIALTSLGLLMRRVGSRSLVLLAASALLVVAPAMTATSSPPLLAAGLVLFGVSTATLNTPMNAQAVAVERRYARPIMSSFHACFSVGTLLGALLGSAAAALRLPPAVQLTVSGAVLATLLFVAVPHLPDNPASPPAERAPRRLTTALLVLAAMGLLSLLAEGTTGAWSAIYVAEFLGAGQTAGAVAYACFAGAMTTGRLFGDRVVARLGRRRFLQASGLGAAAGITLGLAADSVLVACSGFVLLGLGLSCMTPTILGLAGNQRGVSAGSGILVVTLASWPAFLIGPPLVGAVSSQTSLRLALVVVPVAAALLAALATRLPLEDRDR